MGEFGRLRRRGRAPGCQLVLVLGDAHADREDRRSALRRAYSASTRERALQVGDLLHYDLPKPTWFVGGNNERFDTIEAMRAGETPDGVRNATLLASDVVELDGLRVGGLTGNHAPTQFEKSRDELTGDRRRHFVREDVDRLLEQGPVDVLICHEPPHGLTKMEGYDPGNTHVDTLLRQLEPDLCLNGHLHRHCEATIGGTRVVSLAPAWEHYYELDPETLSLSRFETPGA